MRWFDHESCVRSVEQTTRHGEERMSTPRDGLDIERPTREHRYENAALYMSMKSPRFTTPRISKATAQRIKEALNNSPVMALGERGEAVKVVQQALIDMLLQRRPVGEAVLPCVDELRIRERDARLVGELGANAGTGFGVATPECSEQLLGESLLLLDIGARRERAAESRHENLLRIGRRPHSGPKEVEIIGLRLQQVGAALSADRWRPERTMGTLCRGALVCRG